jgi:hypothetical protein
MYRKLDTATPSTARRSLARFADDGRLLALVADDGTDPGPLAFLDVAEGETPLTREQIEAALAELDPDALDAVIAAALAEAEAIDPATATSETVDRINNLGDAVEVARARQQAIADEDEQRQAAAQAALDRLRGPAQPEGEGDAEGDAGDGAEGDAEGADAQTPEPIAASAGNTPRSRRGSALARPGVGTGTTSGMGAGNLPAATAAPAGYDAPRATVALVASAGLDSVQTGGTPVESRRRVGELFGERLEQVRRGRGADGDQLSVVQVRTTYPEARRLTSNATDSNTTRVHEATSREALVAAGQHVAATRPGALVAAGGLCGPIETLNDVPVLGSTARPFRDALANFGADRGGVRWREHLSFGDFADAVGFWTLADDAAVTGDPATEPKTKPCAVVECPGEVEAFVEAITLCLEFSNVTSRFDPEGTAANISAAQIAHARIAENRLMAQVAALSTTVTYDGGVSAVRDLLTHEDALLAQYRSFYRLDDNIAIRRVLPQWVRNMMLADLTRGMAGDLDALAVAEAQILAWFQRRGVNITWHLDGRPAIAGGAGVPAMAAQSYGAFTPGGPIAAYPAQIESFMWVEGDMLHLDGGTLDLGVVRDSQLNAVNRYKTFSESWEGVAHRGVEAIRSVITTNPSGMAAGTLDTAALAS